MRVENDEKRDEGDIRRWPGADRLVAAVQEEMTHEAIQEAMGIKEGYQDLL